MLLPIRGNLEQGDEQEWHGDGLLDLLRSIYTVFNSILNDSTRPLLIGPGIFESREPWRSAETFAEVKKRYL